MYEAITTDTSADHIVNAVHTSTLRRVKMDDGEEKIDGRSVTARLNRHAVHTFAPPTCAGRPEPVCAQIRKHCLRHAPSVSRWAVGRQPIQQSRYVPRQGPIGTARPTDARPEMQVLRREP
jgi:hypothetical protein